LFTLDCTQTINRRSWVKLVIALSTVDTLACYARVTHGRQWYNYNLSHNITVLVVLVVLVVSEWAVS